MNLPDVMIGLLTEDAIRRAERHLRADAGVVVDLERDTLTTTYSTAFMVTTLVMSMSGLMWSNTPAGNAFSDVDYMAQGFARSTGGRHPDLVRQHFLRDAVL